MKGGKPGWSGFFLTRLNMRYCLFCLVALSVIECAAIYAAGIQAHSVETGYQNGRQEIRALLPDGYRTNNAYRVLYVLPVEKGFSSNGSVAGLKFSNRWTPTTSTISSLSR